MNTVGSEQSRPEGRGVSHLCCSKRYSDCTPSHWRARMGGAIGSAPSGIQAFESREAVREVSLCPAAHILHGERLRLPAAPAGQHGREGLEYTPERCPHGPVHASGRARVAGWVRGWSTWRRASACMLRVMALTV